MPGFLVLLFIGMVIMGVLPWWTLFVFFFLMPKRAGFCAANHGMVDIPKEKNDFKRKNDDPTYIRTRDGKWMEIID